MGHSEGRPEKEVDSNTGLPKENRKISNKQSNSISKRTRGTKTKPKEEKEGKN